MMESRLEHRIDQKDRIGLEEVLEGLCSGRIETYDMIERHYVFDHGSETFVQGTSRQCHVVLRRLFEEKNQWEIRFKEKQVLPNKKDGKSVVTGIVRTANANGDVELMLKTMGFTLSVDRILSVKEYPVRMFDASIIISEEWKGHRYLRWEWMDSSSNIYFVKSNEVSNEKLVGDQNEQGSKKRSRRLKRWTFTIKTKKGTDTPKEWPPILGQGTNENCKRAFEIAAGQAKAFLKKQFPTEETYPFDDVDAADVGKCVVSLVTTSAKAELGIAKRNLEELHRVLFSCSHSIDGKARR